MVTRELISGIEIGLGSRPAANYFLHFHSLLEHAVGKKVSVLDDPSIGTPRLLQVNHWKEEPGRILQVCELVESSTCF